MAFLSFSKQCIRRMLKVYMFERLKLHFKRISYRSKVFYLNEFKIYIK